MGTRKPSGAGYDRRPDKESPLWDQYAPLIYLWTAEEQSTELAWIVVYHGGVYIKPKDVGSPSFGFARCANHRRS